MCETENGKISEILNKMVLRIFFFLMFVEKELNRCRENVAEEKKRIGEIEEKLSQVVI